VFIIYLSTLLYKSGLSSRGVVEVLGYIGDFMGVKLNKPSYGTVRIWVQKVGLYLLKIGGREGTKDDKWSIIIDESYTLGKSRLMLVLGINLTRLETGRALKMTDVVPLVIRSRDSWLSEDVSDVLSMALKKVRGKVLYVTSDNGGNLVKAYGQKGISHVPDWSHYSANILENCYKSEADFKFFNEQMGNFKKKRKQSDYGRFTPPSLSMKVRFMNYIPFIEWANLMLKHFKHIPKPILPELQFLKENEKFVLEMTDLFYNANTIGIMLKNKGINQQTQKESIRTLNDLAKKYPDNSRVMKYCEGITSYFDQTIPVFITATSSPHFSKALIASSDVIESIFGKLKHRMPNDLKREFSLLTLIIPLFCRKITLSDVYSAMSTISIADLDQWKRANLKSAKVVFFRKAFDRPFKNGGKKNCAA
jgi:hypothetical protein